MTSDDPSMLRQQKIYAYIWRSDGDLAIGPGGDVSHSESNIIEQAIAHAEMLLEGYWEYVSTDAWEDSQGNEVNPYDTLKSDNTTEAINMIGEINERLKVNSLGCVELSEFNNIIELIEYHKVYSWGSESLRERIESLYEECTSVLGDISDEWELDGK